MTLPRPKQLTGDGILMGAALLAVLVAIALGRYGVETMLPLSALLAFGITMASPMRGFAWTAIRIAFGSLAAVELIHAADRLTPFTTPWIIEGWLLSTDVPYYGFTVMLAAGLLGLPNLRTPRWSLLLAPFLVLAGYLFFRDAGTNVFYFFPILEVILLALSLPALEGFLRGPASPGRVLLTSGLAIRALASFDYVWTLETNYLHFVYLSFLVGNLLLALAVWLEANELRVQIVVPSVVTLFGFQVVLGSHVLVQIDTMGRVGSGVALSVILYTQLLAVLALVLGVSRHRRTRITNLSRTGRAVQPQRAATQQPTDLHTVSSERLPEALDGWAKHHTGSQAHIALIEIRWIKRIEDIYGPSAATRASDCVREAVSATLAPAALVSPWDDGLILALWPTTSDDVEDVLQRAARIAARNTPDPLPRALELQWVHESVTVPGDAAELHRSVGRLDAKLGLAAAESPPQPLRPESEPVGSGT